MGWVRVRRRRGAWAGLAALALQIVLSLGHIHVGNAHIEGGLRALEVAIGNAQPVAAAQSPQKVASEKAPAQNPNPGSAPGSGDSDDYCAICASIFLASTSFAAQPPQLPVPLGFERIALTFAVERSVSTPRPVFFRSRAPPTA